MTYTSDHVSSNCELLGCCCMEELVLGWIWLLNCLFSHLLLPKAQQLLYESLLPQYACIPGIVGVRSLPATLSIATYLVQVFWSIKEPMLLTLFDFRSIGGVVKCCIILLNIYCMIHHHSNFDTVWTDYRKCFVPNTEIPATSPQGTIGGDLCTTVQQDH